MTLKSGTYLIHLRRTGILEADAVLVDLLLAHDTELQAFAKVRSLLDLRRYARKVANGVAGQRWADIQLSRSEAQLSLALLRLLRKRDPRIRRIGPQARCYSID